MAISDIFGSRNEQHNLIGRVDCSGEELSSVFLGLVQSMGMTNPPASTTVSKKGVTISRKGNKYTLTLEMFEPPLNVSWSDPIEISQIVEFLNKISAQNKKVGWVNTINLSDGSKFLQLATN